jgi:RNA polymerase sigma-70 factor (sigma-E family)
MTPGVEQTATDLDLPLSSADRNLNSGSGSIEHQAAILATMQTTGWEDEFREYVRARGPALLRAAHQLTGHPLDAEDLLQSALTKTYLAWDRIEDRGALDGYVRRAMVNINISQWRRRRLEEYPSDDLPEVCCTSEEPHGDVHEQLEQALEELPERMRAAIVLRYYEDMTEPEIARTLGISVGTVKSTVSRAMAKLRKALGLPSPGHGS